MSSRQDVNSAAQAALVPLHSGVDKRPRPLDKDAVLIGRAHGCDIGLDSADISSVHCLITRHPEGWRLRDCASRCGTRVNGEQIKQAWLHDEDILQLGPFSFRAVLPVVVSAFRVPVQNLEKLQRSRRHLVHLALTLRRRLHELANPLAFSQPGELSQKASGLRRRIRTYNDRLTGLEEAERGLCRDRELLEREQEAHQRHVQKLEGEMAQRLKDAEAEIRRRWQDFQKRCEQEDRRILQSRHDQARVQADSDLISQP